MRYRHVAIALHKPGTSKTIPRLCTCSRKPREKENPALARHSIQPQKRARSHDKRPHVCTRGTASPRLSRACKRTCKCAAVSLTHAYEPRGLHQVVKRTRSIKISEPVAAASQDFRDLIQLDSCAYRYDTAAGTCRSLLLVSETARERKVHEWEVVLGAGNLGRCGRYGCSYFGICFLN